MPHVVLKGAVDLRSVFEGLRPLMVRLPNGVLKTEVAYIAHDARAILVEALAIEGPSRTRFLAMLGARDDGLVVRLYPGWDVPKTDGVKRVLAELAKAVMADHPGLSVGETNLTEFLGP
jgi:hypothetical protein